MKYIAILIVLLIIESAVGQTVVDLSEFKKNGTTFTRNHNELTFLWPSGKEGRGKMVLNLDQDRPLFSSVQLGTGEKFAEIASGLDPAFVLRIGKRILSPSSGGWDVFFDRFPTKPYKTYALKLDKKKVKVKTDGTRTIISISNISASTFKGDLEIILYNGTALFNISASITTEIDSTAILYDAGLVSKRQIWKQMAWSDTDQKLHKTVPSREDISRNLEVKYRTIIGENPQGSLALFPAPHQYF
ncbi:hypothetical protein [Arcticibacter eurypsychrophilus]|uniref:hypothetical protein n=1 Tax=Arcticibacter eurypsychrophilus TaxID=1434752 RepID=UPI000B1C821E|nr:hypothetical protein [Arcticibacter eurypsychrophilus]